jgi:23S rRNA (pseudouridine1915-N3)-methyltransferase
MKIACLSVGKKHDPKLVDAIAEYEKRLKSFCDFSWQLIAPNNKSSESALILKFLDKDDIAVLLDERGKLFGNQQLAQYLEMIQNQSIKRLVFIIGGAYGVDENVFRRANVLLSFSPLVFPHQIMRLLLVEQLYRSYSILSGGHYHHE